MFTLVFLVSIASNPVQQYGIDSDKDFQSENACLTYGESFAGQAEASQQGAKGFDCIPKQ